MNYEMIETISEHYRNVRNMYKVQHAFLNY